VARAPGAPARLRAVLFDLDGTLVDSEPTYYEADRRLLASRGIPFSAEDKRRYIGGGNLEMMADLKRRFGFPESAAALAEEKNRIYLELAPHHTRPYPEMARFVERLRGAGLPLAVASGSSPAVLEAVLEAVGLGHAFDAVVSAEEVARGKPAPDVFLEAARRLGAAAPECLVVEDAWQGVQAARSAGMRCLAVPYLVDQPLHAVFAEADLLVAEGAAGFTAERAWALVAPLLAGGG